MADDAKKTKGFGIIIAIILFLTIAVFTFIYFDVPAKIKQLGEKKPEEKKPNEGRPSHVTVDANNPQLITALANTPDPVQIARILKNAA